MNKERPKYTEFPQVGEDYVVSASRVSTWILAQMTPEQFRQVMEGATRKTLPEGFRIELSPAWAERAAIPLIDSRLGVIVGVRLNHPKLQRGSDSFAWQSENVAFAIELVGSNEEEAFLIDALALKLEDRYCSFLHYTKSLDIFLTNIYQEAEHAISGQWPLDASGVFLTPIPNLVEDIPSVLLWISKDMGRFVGEAYPPIRYSLREAVEKVLEQKGS